MKINHLAITGFLSYQEKVTIDFTQFDLACIVGENGAGKSSILDAILWTLFGKCRQSNESLINLQSDEAIVSLSFEYAGENYKVRRSNKRGKPARLTLKTPELDLTERTIRDSQNKIEQILKIDYDTFTHAVFFLQGDSDKFVTATPGKRKQVLFDILGLDAWETFRQNAAAEIKTIEKSMEQAQGSVQVLEEDINKGPGFATDLEIAEDELPVFEKELSDAQELLDAGQKKKDEYTAWKDELATLGENKRIALDKTAGITIRVVGLRNEQGDNLEIVSRKEQIIKDYEENIELGSQVEELQKKQIEFNRLATELEQAENAFAQMEKDMGEIPDLKLNIENWERRLEEVESTELKISEIRENQIKADVETKIFQDNINDLTFQIDGLEGREACPMCDQRLKDPAALTDKLMVEKEEKELRQQQLLSSKKEGQKEVGKLEGLLIKLGQPRELINQAKHTIKVIQQAEVTFDHGKIDEAGIKLTELDFSPAELTGLSMRQTKLKDAPREHGLLEGAEKAGDSLETQIKALEQDLFDAEATVKEYQAQIESKEGLYPADFSLDDNEMALLTRARDAAKAKYEDRLLWVGELQHRLKAIKEKKQQLKEIQEKEKENTELHQKYSILQEAFSKKGVPALLVEQSLPQIESKANQLLHRLSDGDMAVHFITQKAYSDGSREDMKETLDIEIQDQFGIRDYEMYSGGESFRINFAIRMALSNVLANRAGAKLRTLVIDEGFGSQDAGGRDRLINAINTVKEEYDKVLVITHIPEVIESFPVQIRVEKTAAGSQVRIL